MEARTENQLLMIEGMNHTSSLPITSTASSPIQFTELTETGAWMEMPTRSCAVGHAISLKIRNTAKSDDGLHFTAMIDAVEGEPTAMTQKFLISFRQHTPEEWNDLIAHFANEQKKLNALLWRVRR